jgi:hypothetical protein
MTETRQPGGFELGNGPGNFIGEGQPIVGYPHPLERQPDAITPFGAQYGQEFPYPQPGQVAGTGSVGTSSAAGSDELH